MRLPLLLLAAFTLGLAPACAPTVPPERAEQRALPPGLWFHPAAAGSGAEALLAAVARASEHGRDPDEILPPADRLRIEAALRDPAASPAQLRAAEAALTRAFLRWTTALATAPTSELAVALPETLPGAGPAGQRLRAAAAAPDLAGHIQALERRHPLYERLRTALRAARARDASDPRVARLQRNLERARLLPVEGRHIVVDTAGARLFLYDGRRLEGIMRVIVGEPAHPTPAMASLVERAIARPYWNVPEDLARDRIAPRVLREGPTHLARLHYQLLSDWSDNARPASPASVDWREAAAGRVSVRLRQEPGPWNMMGEMKFMIRNDLGIFLHDTPDRALFRAADRARSAGCIRVADWKRLRDWLFEGAPPEATGAAEEAFDLPRPVPIYLLHFTVDPTKAGAPDVPDRYRRDTPQIRIASASP